MSVPFRLGIDFGASTTVAFLARPDGPPAPLVFDGPPAEDRLSRIVAEAQRVAGQPVTTATLAHPVGWDDGQRARLHGAALAAGLRTVELVAAPVAVAALHLRRHPVLGNPVVGASGANVVVLDLGADATVVRFDAAAFRVLASAPLAGVDADGVDTVVRAVVARAGLTGPPDLVLLMGGAGTAGSVPVVAARLQPALGVPATVVEQPESVVAAGSLEMPIGPPAPDAPVTVSYTVALPSVRPAVDPATLVPQPGGPVPPVPPVASPPYPSPAYASPPYPGPPNASPPYPSPPYPGTSYPAPPYAGPSYPGPQHPVPPNAGPPYPGPPFPGPPFPGPPSSGLPYAGPPFPGPPFPGAAFPARPPVPGPGAPPYPGGAVPVVGVETIALSLPSGEGITLRGQLRPGYDIVEYIFPEVDGMLPLFRDGNALLREAAAFPGDPLFAATSWRTSAIGDERRFDLAFVPEHLADGPQRWFPGYLTRCRDICAQLAIFFELSSVQELLNDGSLLDTLDDTLRRADGPVLGWKYRRQLARLDTAEVIRQWRTIVDAIDRLVRLSD